MSRKIFDTMKKRNYECANSHTLTDIRWGKDPLPTCDTCHLMMLEVYHFANQAHGIIPDDIPGGLEIRHGICNPDGSPKKYYSKTDIRRAASEAGLTISGETPKTNSRLNEQKWRDAEKKGRNWI